MLNQISKYSKILALIAISACVLVTSCSKDEDSQPQPTLTSLSISEGEIGTAVTLTGTNFGKQAADAKVFFGATESSVTSMTAMQIVTAVPTGIAPGEVQVKVQVKTLATATKKFTVLAPITVSANTLNATIAENPAVNAVIGTVPATTNRGTLTYSITSQSKQGALAINASSGQLTVANPSLFDYEAANGNVVLGRVKEPQPTITATVSVANGTETATANVNITITDVQEVTLNDFSFTIAENPEANANVGQISATVYFSPTLPISFSIQSQNPAGSVSINNGMLRVANAAAFDFETNPTITGVVSTTYLSETKTANFTITVTDVTETPESFITTTFSAFAGHTSTTGCNVGASSQNPANIRFTTPYFGYIKQPVAYPIQMFIADRQCGVRKLEIQQNGIQILSTPHENTPDPATHLYTYEYIDMAYSLNGTYMFGVYRAVNGGQGNVLAKNVSNNQAFNLSSSTINPRAIATDASGNVYVAEAQTIKKYSFDDSFGTRSLLTTYGEAGSSTSVDGILSAARFEDIQDIQVDANGNIYVADKNAVRKINVSAQTVSTISAVFNGIKGIDLMPDATGIVVADSGNHKIRYISLAGAQPTVFTMISAADLSNAVPLGIMVQSSNTFYFTLSGYSAIYKASISVN